MYLFCPYCYKNFSFFSVKKANQPIKCPYCANEFKFKIDLLRGLKFAVPIGLALSIIRIFNLNDLPGANYIINFAVALTILFAFKLVKTTDDNRQIISSGKKYKLYSPIQIMIGSCLGNIFGGAVLLALNYKEMANKKAMYMTIACAIIFTVIVILTDKICYIFGIPHIIIVVSIFAPFILCVIANHLHGHIYRESYADQGYQKSNCYTLAIGLLSNVVNMIIFGIAILLIIMTTFLLNYI